MSINLSPYHADYCHRLRMRFYGTLTTSILLTLATLMLFNNNTQQNIQRYRLETQQQDLQKKSEHLCAQHIVARTLTHQLITLLMRLPQLTSPSHIVLDHIHLSEHHYQFKGHSPTGSKILMQWLNNLHTAFPSGQLNLNKINYERATKGSRFDIVLRPHR